MIQQGDVLIIKTKEVKGKKLDHVTLALGEATGHHHSITKGDALLFEDENGTLFLDVKSSEAELTHQEHKPVTIKKGKYRVGIVREYDHFAEEAREVID